MSFLAFLPALQADFVTWDDDRNFTDNPHYRGLGWPQLRWMWSTFLMGHYIPLSWMTLGLDYEIWGMNAAGYHFTNLLLHAANAVLLYFLFSRLLRLANVFGEGSDALAVAVPAAIGSLLFAIHPLRVESVVWVTERRDMLSGVFYLSALLFYLRRREPRDDHSRWYWMAVAMFPCALLSKGTAVTLPAVLLVLNVYPLRRLGGQAGWWSESSRRVYIELVPFALMSAAISVLSIVALRPPDQFGLSGKIAVSAYSLFFYLWKTIIPANLAPLYEMPQRVNALAPMFLGSYAFAIALAAAVLALRRKWPGVAAAWIAFFLVILPLLGVVQNGPQIAADRYTYHATPALTILAAGAFALLRRPLAPAPLGVAAVILLVLGAMTWNQTRRWHNSETLWTQVLRVDDRSSIAHIAMGSLLFKQNRVEDAIDHYTKGLAIDPEYAEGYNNLGVALARQGNPSEAIPHYERALGIKPEYAEAHNNWGIALAVQGDIAGAMEHYSKALAIDSTYADAHVNWGNALLRLGRRGEAVPHYAKALAIKPDHADAHHNWGVALAQQGNLPAAIEQFRSALSIAPHHAEARQYLETATRLQRQQTTGSSP